jgi:L-lactate permease
MFEQFTHNYTPIAGNVYLSAIVAAIPIAVILIMLGVLRTKAHWSALAGLVSALLLALVVYGMPAGVALSSAFNGAVFGFWPITWIVINALFLHNLTIETGKFDIVATRSPPSRPTAGYRPDHRLLVRALLEGIAGSGRRWRSRRRSWPAWASTPSTPPP